MEKSILVSLVSEQTIPNILFIKHFKNFDCYFFITTQKMENPDSGNKRSFIIQALGIDTNKCKHIIVNPELKQDVIEQLSKTDIKWDEYTKIVVNLTGGNKMMSLGAYEFFKNYTNEIWYKPINKFNQYHLCDNPTEIVKIEEELNVEEYLAACGILKSENRFSEKKPQFDFEFVKNFFQRYINQEISHDELEVLRKNFRADDAKYQKKIKEKGKIKLIGEEELIKTKEFLQSIKFPIEDDTLTKYQMEFLTGGWFEEYIYFTLKSILEEKNEFIKLGVVLNPIPKDAEKAKYFTNNDLDVIFTYHNNLYVIECKTSLGKELFTETLYKSAALRKYFGLTVESIICTLDELKENQKERAEVFGLKTLDKKVFSQSDIVSTIKKELKIE